MVEAGFTALLPRHQPAPLCEARALRRKQRRSELGHIRELCTDGVFRTSVLPQNCAVLLSTGPQNFDLAVAQDFRVAYLGAQQMNHPFRVFECAVLRISACPAICTL